MIEEPNPQAQLSFSDALLGEEVLRAYNAQYFAVGKDGRVFACNPYAHVEIPGASVTFNFPDDVARIPLSPTAEMVQEVQP